MFQDINYPTHIYTYISRSTHKHESEYTDIWTWIRETKPLKMLCMLQMFLLDKYRFIKKYESGLCSRPLFVWNDPLS